MTQTDAIATRRLCTGVVWCALKDARGRVGADRAEALAWLASTRATLYLDPLDYPQSTVLMRSGWRDWAEEVINDPEAPCTPEQLDILLAGKHYLDTLEARSTHHEDQGTENRRTHLLR